MSINFSLQQRQPKTLKKLENGFWVVWKDDHRSEYPYPYLRRMCPCAECSVQRHGGRDIHSLFAPQGLGDASQVLVADDIHPLDIQLVGRYAVQFEWSDGHASGIYSFETLREICPCEQCTPAANEN